MADAEASGLRARRIRDDPASPVRRHTHATAHVCVVLNARYATEAEPPSGQAGERAVRAGAVLFHPEGTTHADRFLEPGGRFLVVEFTPPPELCDERLPSASTEVRDPQALLVALAIEEQLTLGIGQGNAEVTNLTTELHALISGGSADGPEPPWVSRAEDSLRATVRDGPSLAAVAGDLGIHPVTLTRGFRRYRGSVPSVFLSRLRVAEAVRILEAAPARALSDVALDAGFCDQAHMTRAFARALGTPPGRWRTRRAAWDSS